MGHRHPAFPITPPIHHPPPTVRASTGHRLPRPPTTHHATIHHAKTWMLSFFFPSFLPTHFAMKAASVIAGTSSSTTSQCLQDRIAKLRASRARIGGRLYAATVESLQMPTTISTRTSTPGRSRESRRLRASAPWIRPVLGSANAR